MDINKILKSPIINKAALARLIWPDITRGDAKSRMTNKIGNKNGQRITENDSKLIETAILDLLK